MRNIECIITLLKILLLVLFFNETQTFAAPARCVEEELRQPSGEKFRATLDGDEWFNWVKAENGEILIKDNDDNYWYYAELDDNGLIKGQAKYKIDKKTAALVNEQQLKEFKKYKDKTTKHYLPKLAPVVSPEAVWFSIENSLLYPQSFIQSEISQTQSTTNTQKALVLLVSFTDVSIQNFESTWSNQFFGASNNTLRKYFNEVSNGNFYFTPAEEMAGNVNDGVVKVTLDYPHPNTASNTGSLNQKIVSDALKAADVQIDYSSFDKDGNGAISNDELHIVTIIAGYEASYSAAYNPSVWAHRWDLYYYPTILDEVKLGDYAFDGGYTQQGEIHRSTSTNSHMATIGILAHELGHDLGLPDLYDTDYSSDGIGVHSLMAGGSWGYYQAYPGAHPTHLDPWSKVELGFVNPTLMNNVGLFTLNAAASGSYNILKIPTADVNEYFLIENRQFSGFDIGLKYYFLSYATGGVAIWHIDKAVIDAQRVLNTVNNNENHKGVDLEEANEINIGYSQMDRGIEAGSYDHYYRNSEPLHRFADNTVPNSKLYSNSVSGVVVRVIDSAGNLMRVITDEAAPTGSISINNGDMYTSSSLVHLTLSGVDNSGNIYQMQFSNDNVTWSSWEIYAANKVWQLSNGYAEKTVYVRFRDNAGNISDIYSDNILQIRAPQLSSLTIYPGSLNPNFQSDITAYSVNVTSVINSLDITAVLPDAALTLKINGEIVLSDKTKKRALNYGLNTINILVKALDGTEKTYVIKVTREAAQEKRGYYLPTSKAVYSINGAGLLTKFTADGKTNFPYEIYLPNEESPENYRIHSNYSKNTDACASCHKTHTAVGTSLLQWYTVYETCIACHDGTVTTTYNVVEGYIGVNNNSPTFGGHFGLGSEEHLSSHNVKGGVAVAAAPGGSAVNESSDSNTFGCESCHSPHGQAGNARILHPDPNGWASKNQKFLDNKEIIDKRTILNVVYLTKNGERLTLIKGYPYKIQLKDSIGNDVTENFLISNVGDEVYGSYTTLIPKQGHNADELYSVSGTASVKVRMYVMRYLQSNENVTHISGLNTFCTACHVDYIYEIDGKYSSAHRHTVGMSWNYCGDADEDYIGSEKLMKTMGVNEQYISCLTCHFAHGTSKVMWKNWIAKYNKLLKDNWGIDLALREIAGSSALKRLPNMSTCEVCHQKAIANQGYIANTELTINEFAATENGIFTNFTADYIGVAAGKCQSCHLKQYQEWSNSKHKQIIGNGENSILQTVKDNWVSDGANNGPGSLEAGQYSINDVVYSIGFNKFQSFVINDGDSLIVLPYQWVIADKKWRQDTTENYTEKCIGCHSTGYDVDHGPVEMGISCEACHGPAGNHVKYPASDKNIVVPSSLSSSNQNDLCGQCHALGTGNDSTTFPVGYIPGGGKSLADKFNIIRDDTNNFWPDGSAKAKYMEYNDFTSNNNLHFANGITCITCHSAHSENKAGIMLKAPGYTICATCHDVGADNIESIVNSYMPFTARSIPEGAYDLRSHRMQRDFTYPIVIDN